MYGPRCFPTTPGVRPFRFRPIYELNVYSTVSEITVVRCMFDLTLFDLCAPSSSTSDDAIKGKWVRVPRDLNLQSGMWHLVRSLTLLVVRT
jgi:hypothetical protein